MVCVCGFICYSSEERNFTNGKSAGLYIAFVRGKNSGSFAARGESRPSCGDESTNRSASILHTFGIRYDVVVRIHITNSLRKKERTIV